MISSRENLLRVLRCENPEWIPLCPHLFPNENPTAGIPEELRPAFLSSSARDIIKLGEYLGGEDFLIPVDSPAYLVSDTCSIESRKLEGGKVVTTLTTPEGKLREVAETIEGFPGMVTERYVKTADDARIIAVYFKSLRVVPDAGAVREIRQLKAMVGDKGVLFLRTNGTPLGMCYRVYSDIASLVYMIADAPEIMNDLFALMEEKYFQAYECFLREAPEIDAYLGMDDTSTTLVSPAMFDSFNVELTNRRADLCHAHGRIYMHHSCGLIRNLLPIYRKTRMDGVDAFTPPPIGDVGYADGRRLLGPGYSMITGLGGGLRSMDADLIRSHVRERVEDARAAGNVVFLVGGAHLSFAGMKLLFDEARKIKDL